MSRSLIALIMISVARQASGHIVIASPQPTIPSLVSIRHRVKFLIDPLSFGSGYETEIGSIFEILDN